MSFRLVVEQAALDFLLDFRGPERTTLLRFLNQLCTAPDTRGELRFQDETMRWVERKVVGRLRVTYWPDYAVSELRVVAIARVR